MYFVHIHRASSQLVPPPPFVPSQFRCTNAIESDNRKCVPRFADSINNYQRRATLRLFLDDRRRVLSLGGDLSAVTADEDFVHRRYASVGGRANEQTKIRFVNYGNPIGRRKQICHYSTQFTVGLIYLSLAKGQSGADYFPDFAGTIKCSWNIEANRWNRGDTMFIITIVFSFENYFHLVIKAASASAVHFD